MRRVAGYILLFLCGLLSGLASADDLRTTSSPFAGLIVRVQSQESPRVSANDIFLDPHLVQMQNLGSDAQVCRLHLFRHVQNTLDILTYIWNEDASGRYMMREAIHAAERGVKVRILVDTIGTPEDLAMIAYFATAHPNLEFRIYNPISRRVLPSRFHLYREIFLKFRKFNQRMHTKLMIADGQVAITGGRNFGDEYFDVNDNHNFKDRDILVIGPMLGRMQEVFEDFWEHERSVPAENLIDVKKAIKRLSRIDPQQAFYQFNRLFDDVSRKADDPDYIRRKFVDTAFLVNKLMFVNDPPGKSPRMSLMKGWWSRATSQLLLIVKETKSSIVIQSPYFVLDDNEIPFIRRKKTEHPELDIVVSTNSLAATDSIYAYAYAFKRHKTYVNDLGVRLFEIKPVRMELYTLKYLRDLDIEQSGYDPYLEEFGLAPGDYYAGDGHRHVSIHAKSFVIDDTIAWIGSTNLDSRSFHWNTEIGVAVWDEKFAQALKEDMMWDMSPVNSWAVAPRVKGLHLLRRAHEPIGTLMERLPAVDVWPLHYTSAFELKKGETPVAMSDPSFYDRYEDVGSFPLLSPLTQRYWRLRGLKSLIGLAEPVL